VISLSSLPAGSSSHHSLSREVAHNWLSVKSRFADIVTDINSIDLIDLMSSEFESFERIIDRVNDKPPSTGKLSKEHRKAHKHITASIKAAWNHLADEKFEQFQSELRTLHNDIFHQYEPFFRLSQIDRAWKTTVVDECRRSLECLINYGELWNEIGSVKLPDFLNEVGACVNALTTRRSVASLIPRLSPRRHEKNRGATSTLTDKPNPPHAKPVEKRPRASSVSRVIPAEKSKESQMTLIEKQLHASSVSRVIPAEKSKESQMTPIEKQLHASSVSRVAATEKMKRPPTGGAVAPDSDPIFADLLEFERRVARYNAGIVANEHLMVFASELRAMQKFRQREPHLTRLRGLLAKVDGEIAATDATRLFDKAFKDAAAELAQASRMLIAAQAPEARRLAEEVELIATMIDSAQPNPQKKLCDDVLGLVAKILDGMDSHTEVYRRLITEMKGVQERIKVLRAERKRTKVKNRDEIDAELDAFQDQQTGIIEKLVAQQQY
jgi:hypothetical protein